MMLCLDVGNTHIFAGVFLGEKIQLHFRYPSDQACTSDVLGLFFRNALRENGIDPSKITAIGISSVVPALGYTISAACKKYFGIDPVEIYAGLNTGITLDVTYPTEVGADRITNAAAATHYYPNRNIILLDFGTATTVCAISKQKAFLGGAILPGFKLCMEALASKTAKLSAVNIVKCENALGKETDTNIQSGLYYGQLGAVKEIIQRIQQEVFLDDPAVVIATGGYSHLFENEGLFEKIYPDLVLDGLRLILEKHV